MQDPHSNENLKLEISSFADHLAPHHFQRLSKGIGLWEKHTVSPNKQARPKFDVASQVGAQSLDFKAPNLEPVNYKTKLTPPVMPKYSKPIPVSKAPSSSPLVEPLKSLDSDFPKSFDSTLLSPRDLLQPLERVQKNPEHKIEIPNTHVQSHILVRGFFFLLAHILDLSIVAVCSVFTLLSLKVMLFGYGTTVQEGVISFLAQWLKIFDIKELGLALYGLFLIYALFFKILVGHTLGGLIFQKPFSLPRSKG